MSYNEKMKLTSKNVSNVFFDCLFRQEEIKDNKPLCDYTFVKGIRANFAFNSERLNKHQKDITDMIDQLPGIENETSFLNLCMTKDGIQWGEHENVEQLVVLGVASGNLEYLLPKEMWSLLPGNMPIVIKRSKEKVKKL